MPESNFGFPTSSPPPSSSTATYGYECPRCGWRFANAETKRCAQCGLTFIEDTDQRSIPLMILGFLLPPAGWAAFLLLRRERPKRAASAAQGTLWSPLLYLLVLPYLANAGVFNPLLQAFRP